MRLTFSFGRFVFLLCLAPSGLVLPWSWSFRSSVLPVLSPFLCLPVGRWLLPPPPSAVFVVFARCLGFFFFSSSFVRPCCLRLSLVSGPGCPGPRRCVLFALLAFRFSALRALSPLSCFPPGRWLPRGGCCPPPPPPPPFVSRSFRPCCSVLRAVCCAVLCVPGCGAAPRCCALCRPVLCSRVLCCFVGPVWCRCLLRRALWRCPSPWGTALCGAVFCGVPPCCVLCAVCILLSRGGACCCLPLCFVLCVSRGAVLCVPCPLRSVQCCALLCWCACVVLFVWCMLLLAPGAVARCCALCCFLWCAVVRCWVWSPVVVCWWRVSVSVSLSDRVVCFPVVGVVCCGALLPCVVCCGAVLSRGAVLLCSAVVLGCSLGLFCPPVACRAVLCCAVGWLCSFFLSPVVVYACCGALSLVLCVPCLLRSVRCGTLLCWLCCPASLCRVLWRCAVAWCCALVLCCRFAVLFVFALPSCGLSCGAVLCCVVLLVVCAVFCPVVAFVCCGALSLPAGTHKKHQLSYMSPRVGGGVVAGLPWWLRCPGLGAAYVLPAAKGRQKRRGLGTGGRGRCMVNKRGREGRVQGRGVLRNFFSSFTRCSRRSFLCVDGVLDNGRDGVMFL